MEVILGIDIGGSTTKIIGMKDNKIIEPLLIHAEDPITSLFGAFGKFLYKNSIDIKNISKIMVTGVGSTFLNDDIYGIKTIKVPEFDANGLGGLYLSEKKQALVVSLGTGTSIVLAKKDDSNVYMGGTAVGGGSIVGLCKKMINVSDIEKIVQLAENGDISKIDLTVSDIANPDALDLGLVSDLTASNFGKLNSDYTNEDIAIGVLNLVFQSVSMTSAFASKNANTNDVVLIGNLSSIDICKNIFDGVSKITGVNFIFPKMSKFATALGAVLYK